MKTPSSARKRWGTSNRAGILAAGLLAASVTTSVTLSNHALGAPPRPAVPAAPTGAGVTSTLSGSFDARIANRYEMSSLSDLSSLKLTGRLEQKVNIGSQWSLVGSLRAWSEAAYALNPVRYPASLSQKDSGEVTLRELYAQFRSGGFFLRIGNQQVVWGDAFGFFYSDIVNPKDLRDGLFGDFAEIRNPIPIVNSRFTLGSVTLQGIWVLGPSFDLLPLPGSDFAYPYSTVLPGWNVTTTRETRLPFALSNTEPGARLNVSLESVDLSAFYFDHFDSQPYYSLGSFSLAPAAISLVENHSRIYSYGITGTVDPGAGYIVRFEGLIHKNRVFPKLLGTTLSTLTSDELIYVVGLDFPAFDKWNLSAQWSESILSASNTTGLLHSPRQSLVSWRLGRTFRGDVSANLIYAFSVSDLGHQISLSAMMPLSGQVEASIGSDILAGPPSSEFGRNGPASRVYFLIRSYFRS